MRYSKFQQLVEGREKANVDFKIKCDAFLSRSLAPKAELAKDICAMANNGNVSNYILIGVSDDGKSFKSVSNTKLTDDNLQDFCKKSISPPPIIKIHKECWEKVTSHHARKNFIIIQVGPNARQAFRLARDFISYREQTCYRRNEVWIRRGATSDLATPEEIARLVKGKPPIQESKPEHNVEYTKLPIDEQIKAIQKDFQKCVEEVGGCIYGHRAVIPLRNLRYVWHYIIRREYAGNYDFLLNISLKWQFEHGFLILIMKTIPKRALPKNNVLVHFKEKWGWFTYYKKSAYSPTKVKDISLVTLTLPNIADTDILQRSFLSMLQFLEENHDSYNRIRMARNEVNLILRGWKKVRHEESRRWRAIAQTVLDLSSGRLT